MRSRRLLVVAAMAIAFVSTEAAARPQAKKQITKEIAKLECFRDEDRPGGRMTCLDARGSSRTAGNAYAAAPYRGSGSSSLIVEARRYEGMTAKQIGLPPSLWCGDFMAKVAPAVARQVPNPRMARDWLAAGRRVAGPHIGAIAVFTRGKSRRNGHVGIVTGVAANGDPIIVSGNYNGRVAEAPYPRGRVIAYVEPGA